jgi:hypothetical protein
MSVIARQVANKENNPEKIRGNMEHLATVQESSSQNDISHRQIEAMRRFRKEISNCDEPVPEFERVTLRDIAI